MKSFEYAAPATVKDAVALLGEQWGDTEILAGGTDLITALKQGITSPKRVVSLKGVGELRGINAGKNQMTVGAMTTLGELVGNDTVQQHFPALVTAAKNVGSPQLLNMGTVGGDLCQRPRCWFFRNGHGLFGKENNASLVRDGDNRYHAIFGTDGPALFVSASSLGPPLVALGATFIVAGPKGKTRKVPAAEFFRAPKSDQERETSLKPGELLAQIQIPIRGLKNATYEVRHRHGLDWPYVTATVAFMEKNGTLSDGHVVLGHVAATPWRATAASRALNGAKLGPDTAAKCAEAAVQGAAPLSRNGYKIQLTKAAVKRAVLATATA